jgi:hypothetical protein
MVDLYLILFYVFFFTIKPTSFPGDSTIPDLGTLNPRDQLMVIPTIIGQRSEAFSRRVG